MGRLIWVLLLILDACATIAPLSPSEQCSSHGMIVKGIGLGSSDGVVVYGGRYAKTYSEEQSVSCEPPKTMKEKCEVRKYQSTAAIKSDYNDGIKWKRIATGTGYFLYIVPGIALKYNFDKNRDDALKRADAEDTALQSQCDSLSPN